MDDITLAVTEQVSDHEREFFTHLREYNDSQVGPSGAKGLALFARRADGEIVGGLQGMTYWSWLHVYTLVVAEAYRKQGLGSLILAEAEAEAARRGCIGVYLETMSFQALPFYRKHGYEVFGQLEECPPGHMCYFLQKKLYTEE